MLKKGDMLCGRLEEERAVGFILKRQCVCMLGERNGKNLTVKSTTGVNY